MTETFCVTHPTEEFGVGLGLPEQGLVFRHGVLMQHLLSVCFIGQLKQGKEH